MKYAKIIAASCVAAGIITAVLSFLGFYFLPFAMLFSIAGFILSSIYISITTRNNLRHKIVNPAYIGLLLSSTPLILFLVASLMK